MSQHITQEFHGVALRKLTDLLAAGWNADGVSISRHDGEKVNRGLITTGGMVCWWTSQEDIVRLEERIIERERARIKDGIMVLALTAENLRTDTPDVDTARKALALRITTLVDGRGDLVLTDAGQRMLQLNAPAGVTVAAHVDGVPVDPYHHGGGPDPLLDQARALVTGSEGKGSISYVQRKLMIGYNRAARLLEALEIEGVVSPMNGAGGRTVLKKGGAA